MRAELLDQADSQRTEIIKGTATTSCIHVILQEGHSEEHYILDFSGWRKRKTFRQRARNCAALPSPSGEGGRKREPARLTERSHPFTLSSAHQDGDTYTWHEDRACTHIHTRATSTRNGSLNSSLQLCGSMWRNNTGHRTVSAGCVLCPLNHFI